MSSRRDLRSLDAAVEAQQLRCEAQAPPFKLFMQLAKPERYDLPTRAAGELRESCTDGSDATILAREMASEAHMLRYKHERVQVLFFILSQPDPFLIPCQPDRSLLILTSASGNVTGPC